MWNSESAYEYTYIYIIWFICAVLFPSLYLIYMCGSISLEYNPKKFNHPPTKIEFSNIDVYIWDFSQWLVQRISGNFVTSFFGLYTSNANINI